MMNRAQLSMNPVGTRSTASELLMREIPDAVERVPTLWCRVGVEVTRLTFSEI